MILSWHSKQTGTHPRDTTYKNVDRFRQQLKSIGFSYDWKREISTTDPKYYKWTQWIFQQLIKKDLAYQVRAFATPLLGYDPSQTEQRDRTRETASSGVPGPLSRAPSAPLPSPPSRPTFP